MPSRVRLAVLLASLARGGIGKMRVHLVNEFSRRGFAVDLLLAELASPYLQRLSQEVNLVPIYTSHALSCVPLLAWYLRRRQPEVLLTQRVRVNVAALRAHRLSATSTRIVSTLNTHLSSQLTSMRERKRNKQLRLFRRYYPRNDGLIAVSEGVAVDAAQLIGLPRERIQVANNPVVTPDILEKARQPCGHPWLDEPGPPVFMGMGRLEPQKDFALLLRAFASVRQRRRSRLIILGEGGLREELLLLARQLGVADDVALPGFVATPYAFLARARVFVLSSAWEGSPNALTEALAVGTPTVSTDCPSGPREILAGGLYGPLVPVRNEERLAQAMLHTLENPPEREFLRARAQCYSVEASATQYLQAMGLT